MCGWSRFWRRCSQKRCRQHGAGVVTFLARRALLLAASVAVLSATGCSGGDGDPTALAEPVRLEIVTPATLTLGDSAQFTAQIIRFDSTVQPANDAVFTVDEPAVLQLDRGGFARSRSAGTVQLRVTAGGLSADRAFNVTPRLRSLVMQVKTRAINIGDSARVTTGATDSAGVAVVPFAQLDAEPTGVVQIRNGWVIATRPGTVSIRGRASGFAVFDTLVSLQPSASDIRLTPNGAAVVFPARVTVAMSRVQARLRQIVRLTPAGAQVRLDRFACENIEAIDERVNGIRLLVVLGLLADRTIGLAGPCVLRENQGLPLLGSITLDSAKIKQIPDSLLEQLLLHESLHVMGIGVLWNTPAYGGHVVGNFEAPDPIFTGPAALRGWARIRGAAAITSRPIPIEIGTLGHWRSPALANELMAGRLLAGQALSAITVGALRDVGWEVEPEAYEDLDLTPAPTPSVGTARVTGTSLQARFVDALVSPRYQLQHDRRIALIVQTSPGTGGHVRRSRSRNRHDGPSS